MARTCTVCSHVDLEAINKALAAGTSPSDLAARYCTVPIGRMSFERHKDNHLPAEVAKAQEVEDVRQALDIVKQLKAINGASLSILKEARAVGAHGLALQAIDRVHKQIELQAKLLGELDDRPQINILLAPEWLVVRAALFSALQHYPEARATVAGALLQLEAGR